MRARRRRDSRIIDFPADSFLRDRLSIAENLDILRGTGIELENIRDDLQDSRRLDLYFERGPGRAAHEHVAIPMCDKRAVPVDRDD